MTGQALPTVLALSGGVGGAKFALGLYRVLESWSLGLIVNTGDDFEHFGLHIAPDIDTAVYTLSGNNNISQGWGREGETWSFLEQLEQLGGSTWFRLGDGDLAMHVRRTELLRSGWSLSEVTDEIAHRFGLELHIFPMSDDPVRTIVLTKEAGELPFQHYFVKRQCQDSVRGFRYDGAKESSPNAKVLEALENPALRAVFLCPSNPFVSINPILSVPDIREALKSCKAPKICVSPIVNGDSVRGPLGKMYREMGKAVNHSSLEEHYGDFLSGMIMDSADADQVHEATVPTFVTSIVMQSIEDRENLALEALNFADSLARQNSS